VYPSITITRLLATERAESLLREAAAARRASANRETPGERPTEPSILVRARAWTGGHVHPADGGRARSFGPPPPPARAASSRSHAAS
jgi:hypothetical protein